MTTLTKEVVDHSFNALRSSIYPHIDSYNTFLNFYRNEIVKELDTLYIDPHFNQAEHELNPFYQSKVLLKIRIISIRIHFPSSIDINGDNKQLYPRICRESHTTYSGKLEIEFIHELSNNESVIKVIQDCGEIPIMVGSDKCGISNKSIKEKLLLGEELSDPGGYFIVNGNERMIRYVIQPRSNYPMVLKESKFTSKDLFVTQNAISIRCERLDGTSTTNILYYTEDLQCLFRVLINRQEVIIPFWTLLRALMPLLPTEVIKDKVLEWIWNGVDEQVDGSQKVVSQLSEFNMQWMEFMNQESLFLDSDNRENRYLLQLGKLYWNLVNQYIPPDSLYEDAGRYVLRKYVLVHCEHHSEKFECLLYMYHKLLTFIRGEILEENQDSFAFQQVITPGSLYASVLKSSLMTMLNKVKLSYQAELRLAHENNCDPEKVLQSKEQFELILGRVAPEISHAMNYFVGTGNIKSRHLDLQQLTGWTIAADRLNMNRFLSHFRAVHRGHYFTQIRTTDVRKLLGETWGFLCPVHTPDGGPCGLLLHLTKNAIPITSPTDRNALASLKVFFHNKGVLLDMTGDFPSPPNREVDLFPVVIDGIPLCRLPLREFEFWAEELSSLKNSDKSLTDLNLPLHTEIVCFSREHRVYCGIYLFTNPGRIMRPVKHINTGRIDWIGPLSQPWMDIGSTEEEAELSNKLFQIQSKDFNDLLESIKNNQIIKPHILSDFLKKKTILLNNSTEKKSNNLISNMIPVKYSHVEISPSTILSITSALTPFSHHNQSPRNMYQCQMLKQTMGAPLHSHQSRFDNKAYHLTYAQKPCVRTSDHDTYSMDNYPTGINAIVAVISHTGFDMEDAMILNKSSVERGAFHGILYKSKIIDSAPLTVSRHDAKQYMFSNINSDGSICHPDLDMDGLPYIGSKLSYNKTLYRTIKKSDSSDNYEEKTACLVNSTDTETQYIDSINFVSLDNSKKNVKSKLNDVCCPRVILKLRCPRNPIVGDKFASRAGQKGILSLLWPQEDMPFSESGIVPDIMFNPHGFPSRMTIGMLIEAMAGKGACLYGQYQDATPFKQYPFKTSQNPWINSGGYHGWVCKDNKYILNTDKHLPQNDTSIDFFGKSLLEAGYQYYGTEPLYSGIYGGEMNCHIFMGVIYYQRLRHMISDKWQVRSTGPVDILTQQPIKGRKRGGGVRFGEMERDALLGHGATYLLQDRLMHCSDEHQTYVCPSCDSLLAPILPINYKLLNTKKTAARCRVCNIPCRLVSLPFVLRYINNEFASMNITIKLKMSERDQTV